MTYIQDQEQARIKYQELAEQRARTGKLLKLWVKISLGILVVLIAGVIAYELIK